MTVAMSESTPTMSSISTGSRSELIERNRLLSSEAGWNLSGSLMADRRTRHGGNGRPTNLPKGVLPDPPSSSDASYSTDSTSATDDDETMADEAALLQLAREAKLKPPAENILISVDAMTATLEQTSHCKRCNGPVNVTMKTICLASRIMLTCKSDDCGWVFHSPESPPATLDEQSDNDSPGRSRSSDYAINILYILGFLSVGDGGAEAARILGLLGLPNDTTMESRTFPMRPNQC
jgi:hypothetical protein